MKLTNSTRGVQARRLYAALRSADYLKEEPEMERFARRLSDALWRHGFYVLLLSDEELGQLPEELSADTPLLGGDSEVDR